MDVQLLVLPYANRERGDDDKRVSNWGASDTPTKSFDCFRDPMCGLFRAINLRRDEAQFDAHGLCLFYWQGVKKLQGRREKSTPELNRSHFN